VGPQLPDPDEFVAGEWLPDPASKELAPVDGRLGLCGDEYGKTWLTGKLLTWGCRLRTDGWINCLNQVQPEEKKPVPGE
jgi:hypothetical protein